MNTEWTPLDGLKDVSDAEQAGWEIEVKGSSGWCHWNGTSWSAVWDMRGRPKQPKKIITVTSLCWRNKRDGNLCWYSYGNEPSSDWQRFPAGDITGEVEE